MFQICFRCENKLIYTGSFCHLYDSVKKLNLGRQGFSSISTVLERKQVFSYDDLYTLCFLSMSEASSYSAHLKHAWITFWTFQSYFIWFHCIVFNASVCISWKIHLEVLYFTGFFCLFSCPYCVGVGKRDAACYVYRTTIKITLE